MTGKLLQQKSYLKKQSTKRKLSLSDIYTGHSSNVYQLIFINQVDKQNNLFPNPPTYCILAIVFPLVIAGS